VILKVGYKIEPPTKRLDIASHRLDCGHSATLDLRNPAGGDLHQLGKLSLGQPMPLSLIRQPLSTYTRQQRLATTLGLLLTADTIDIGFAIPPDVSGHDPASCSAAPSDISRTDARRAESLVRRLRPGRGRTGVTQSTPGGTATGPAPGTHEQGIEDYKLITAMRNGL
jgi:hypothetical protein